jgi:ABC-type polysaccharide/polyol phosphate export permease
MPRVYPAAGAATLLLAGCRGGARLVGDGGSETRAVAVPALHKAVATVIGVSRHPATMGASSMRAAPVWTRSVATLTWVDLRRRYAGSALGAAWAVAGPLLEVAVYAAVFGLVLSPAGGSDGVGFALFVASGLLPWGAFREAVEGTAALLPDNRWIRRSRVPFELLVARHVLAAAARGLVGLVLVIGAAVVRGGWPGWPGLLLPIVALALQTASAYGLGLALAPLGTLHPDLRPGLASALTLLTFASPIVYPETAVPEAVRGALAWNPYTYLLRLYRLPLAPEQAGSVAGAALVAVALPMAALALGALVRRRLFWDARDRL